MSYGEAYVICPHCNKLAYVLWDSCAYGFNGIACPHCMLLNMNEPVFESRVLTWQTLLEDRGFTLSQWRDSLNQLLLDDEMPRSSLIDAYFSVSPTDLGLRGYCRLGGDRVFHNHFFYREQYNDVHPSVRYTVRSEIGRLKAAIRDAGESPASILNFLSLDNFDIPF